MLSSMSATKVSGAPAASARSAKAVAKKTVSHLPGVDAYIASAAEFAQPILNHVREVVHKAVPGVEEAIKWSHPFFLYHGIILGNMAAFKEHCSVGLWGSEVATKMREGGVYSRDAMGVLGKLSSVADLPKDKEFIAYLREATAAIDEGRRTQSFTRPKTAKKKAPAEVPEALAAGLAKNKVAAKNFAAMAPGAQREYCEWISEAKRDETRDKRAATAVEWIAENKRRNWKYENC